MIKRFMNSRWWHLTAAITALMTVGYVIYMASAFHVLMVWFLMKYDKWWMNILCLRVLEIRINEKE